jgi:hypothetical protein
MSSTSYDITGLDLIDVVEALWGAQKVTDFFGNFPGMAPKFNREGGELLHIVNEYRFRGKNASFDYIDGRAIKIHLWSGKEPIIDLALFDEDAGKGAGKRALDKLKRN